jgi:hypothetical protein
MERAEVGGVTASLLDLVPSPYARSWTGTVQGVPDGLMDLGLLLFTLHAILCPE